MTYLDVNCVYGDEHIEHIEKCLLPSLHYATNGKVQFNAINYNPRSGGRLSSVGSDRIIVNDIENRSEVATGFAANHNLIFNETQPRESFILVNPDCIPQEGAVDALVARKAGSHGRVGIVEGRQWPFEHPKAYDPVTLETPWASGAFCLIDAEFYRSVGGMDDIYFLYMEDVDLSWQAWLNGYRVLFEPAATTMHFSGGPFYRDDLESREQWYSIRNFLILARKFFGAAGEMRALHFLRSQPNQEAVNQAIVEYRADFVDRISTKYINTPHHYVKIFDFCRFSALRSI